MDRGTLMAWEVQRWVESGESSVFHLSGFRELLILTRFASYQHTYVNMNRKKMTFPQPTCKVKWKRHEYNQNVIFTERFMPCERDIIKHDMSQHTCLTFMLQNFMFLVKLNSSYFQEVYRTDWTLLASGKYRRRIDKWVPTEKCKVPDRVQELWHNHFPHLQYWLIWHKGVRVGWGGGVRVFAAVTWSSLRRMVWRRIKRWTGVKQDPGVFKNAFQMFSSLQWVMWCVKHLEHLEHLYPLLVQFYFAIEMLIYTNT